MAIIFQLPQHTTAPQVVFVEPTDVPNITLLNRIELGVVAITAMSMGGVLQE
jgi:hypothetical protein